MKQQYESVKQQHETTKQRLEGAQASNERRVHGALGQDDVLLQRRFVAWQRANQNTGRRYVQVALVREALSATW